MHAFADRRLPVVEVQQRRLTGREERRIEGLDAQYIPSLQSAGMKWVSGWQGDALRQADKLATDDIGQMGYYREAGYFKDTPKPYADLGEIVAGKKPGRENAKERTICINLGLALDDMATAILIYKKAKEKGIGTQLNL